MAKRKLPPIHVVARIEPEDLAEELSQDEAFALIKAIDAWQADYGFTKRLRDFFTKELAKEDSADKPKSRQSD